MSELLDSDEICGATPSSTATCDLDLMQYPIECSSDSQQQRLVPFCDNAADAGSSGKPDAEVYTPQISEFSFIDLQNPQELTVEDYDVEYYKQHEVYEIKLAREMVKKELTQCTASRLRDSGFTEDECKLLADIVMNGEKITNADEDRTDYIHCYYQYLQDLPPYQFLLIGNDSNSKDRKNEMKNLCQRSFSLDPGMEDKIITYRDVQNLSQVKMFVHDFFQRSDGVRATNALHTAIIFFSQRPDLGFSTGQEHMPLEELGSLVRDEYRKALRDPLKLPVEVQVILAQSYDDVCEPSTQCNRLKVTAFWNNKHPRCNEERGINNIEQKQYAEGSPLQVTEVHACSDNDATSSTCDLDLPMRQCKVPSADSGSSSEPGAEAAAPAASPSLITKAKEIVISSYTNFKAIRLKASGVTEEGYKPLADLMNVNRSPTEYTDESYKSRNNIESFQILLISILEISKENDSEERKQEMQNFCVEMFPVQVDGKIYFNVARLDKMITWQELDNREEVRTIVGLVTRFIRRRSSFHEQLIRCIQNFFNSSKGIRAKNALCAKIVFFAHGSKAGLRVGNEDIPLDEIVSLVKDEWNKARSHWPLELPVNLEIIFPQCYGYMFDHSLQSDNFKVTALTTERYYYVPSLPNAEGRLYNYRLRRYAEGPLQEEFIHATGPVTLQQQAIVMENWRRSDNDASVDSGLTRKDINGMSPTTPASATADPVVERQSTYSDL